MRILKFFLVCVMLSLLLATSAMADVVRIFMPMDEELSAMDIRKKAMNEGFAVAVVQEAQNILSAPLDEVRAELFKEYLLAHSKPYVQGYKTISSEALAEGLILVLDVNVNKTTLREGLRRMGLLATAVNPQAASVTWPEAFGEETVLELQRLMTLTGIALSSEAQPAFRLESGPEGTFKGHLSFDGREWVVVNKDMANVWFDLWAKYFTRSEVAQVRSGIRNLAVSGWFSPDAAMEFDRVLSGWDSAVQDVSLLELEMLPSGVGGTWEIRLLDSERLDILLKSYLPQRGLSYQLSEEPTQ